jgi:hypothetical protein
VRGRGVLDGHDFLIDDLGPSLINLPSCFALVEGVTLLDSPKYNVDSGWPYTTVAWVKAIAWAFSTDGFTAGAQAFFHDSFLKVNDDSLKLFGSGALAANIVLWQMENGCVVMGSWNLNTPEGFITASGLDVIRHERKSHGYDPDAVFCFMHGGSGALANYLFENVRVDMPGWAAVQVFIVLNPWAHPSGALGGVTTVIVRNLSSASAFGASQPVQLQGNSTTSAVTGVVLDGVSFGGRPATQADIAVTGSQAFVGPVTVCEGCSWGTVGSDWTPAQKCSMPTSFCESSEAGGTAAVTAAAAAVATATAALATD